MSFGLEIYGPSGELQMGADSFTVRLVLATLVTFNGPKSFQDFSVPGCNSGNSTAFVIKNAPLTVGQRSHETEMLTDVARVYNHTRTFEASTISSGTMLLYVVRFR